MLFSGGIIPTYLLVQKLGLLNSLWAVILSGMVNVYNILVIKTYFENLPESLVEAARIDGASRFYILIKIIVPVSIPIIATVSLFLWSVTGMTISTQGFI